MFGALLLEFRIKLLLSFKVNKRYELIDILRGLAVWGMVFYHFVFLMNFLDIYKTNLQSSFFIQSIGSLVRIIFFVLVGVSSVIIYNKFQKTTYINYVFRQLRRASIVMWSGILITIACLVFFPQYAIYFGVLHSIGIGILLSFAFVGKKNLSLILGLCFLFSKIFILKCTDTLFPLSYALGFSCDYFNTFDYFPLFPWLGLIFIGQAYGNEILEFLNSFKVTSKLYSLFSLLIWSGRHSLAIYLLHVPVIFIVLYLVRLVLP